MTLETAKMPAANVDEICRHACLSPPARALVTAGLTPAACFNLLIEHKHHRDAIRFAAQLLSPRQAIWWGCLCVWQALRPQPDAAQAAALHAAVQWTLDPDEPRRRAAEAAGRAVGADQPAGALALAVFAAGPTLSRPDLPAVPPPAGLAAQTVAAAVLAAVASGPPDQLEHRQRQVLSMAIEVTQQWDQWQEQRKS